MMRKEGMMIRLHQRMKVKVVMTLIKGVRLEVIWEMTIKS
jgi:hypothetical protein